MAADKGLLFKAFDAAERAVAPHLEAAVRTGTFAHALSLVTRVDAGVRHGLESRSRRLWHAVNLPAGSDVTRLRRQIATLDRDLRQISQRLDRALAELETPQEDPDDADPSRPPGRERPARALRDPGPRAPGRRAQRAPRS